MRWRLVNDFAGLVAIGLLLLFVVLLLARWYLRSYLWYRQLRPQLSEFRGHQNPSVKFQLAMERHFQFKVWWHLDLARFQGREFPEAFYFGRDHFTWDVDSRSYVKTKLTALLPPPTVSWEGQSRRHRLAIGPKPTSRNQWQSRTRSKECRGGHRPLT